MDWTPPMSPHLNGLALREVLKNLVDSGKLCEDDYISHNAYIPCKEKFETEDPIQKRDLFKICARFPLQDLYK